jgi:hypothetical protein
MALTGQWAEISDMLSRVGNPAIWQMARKRAMLREAHRLRTIMVQSFNRGGPPGKKWKALSAFTQILGRIRGKGDRRPLMDSGDLRNSHSVVEEDEDTVFVGVHRTARSKKKGKKKMSIVNLAAVHENGAGPFSVKVSEKMRRWWRGVLVPGSHGQIKPLSPNTRFLVIRIPARPWIGPIWDKEQDTSSRNIMQDTVEGLGVPMFAGLIR